MIPSAIDTIRVNVVFPPMKVAYPFGLLEKTFDCLAQIGGGLPVELVIQKLMEKQSIYSSTSLLIKYQKLIAEVEALGVSFDIEHD